MVFITPSREYSSHESLDRTVVLPGYPDLDIGVYRGRFTFSGPNRISKIDRTRADGRIWTGEVDSNTIEVRIEN
jgi:hypothetical protein